MPNARNIARYIAVLFGIGLLAWLVVRVGTRDLVSNASAIGWGMLAVLTLAGIAHLVKTWAWRLTFADCSHKPSVRRLLGLRLASEAMGQFGIFGQVFGEAARVSYLPPEVPTANGVSSVALDRGLFIATGAAVTVIGLLAATVSLALPSKLRIVALVFIAVLVALLAFGGLMLRKGWRLASGTTRALKAFPWLRNWLERQESLIASAEHALLRFHRENPRAFWFSVILNFVTHAFAITEIYLILLLMHHGVAFAGALILEALTKLINSVGSLNPGNVGTYEGGNMLIAKLLRVPTSTGLALALCRRLRSIFWALIGGICFLWISRGKNQRLAQTATNGTGENKMQPLEQCAATRNSHVAIVIANSTSSPSFDPLLARVGSLPVLLRAILGVKAAGASRILVFVDGGQTERIRCELSRTGRLPASVEWIESFAGSADLQEAVSIGATLGTHLVLVMGDRTYHPSLHRAVAEWDGKCSGLELLCGQEPVGMMALSRNLAIAIGSERDANVRTIEDLYHCLLTHALWLGTPLPVLSRQVERDLWQRVQTAEQRRIAEDKLDSWLTKPTDGIFARLNRRVSIPISRQLIKFPITANMVTIFTLGVSISAGLFYARGGYWNILLGAALSWVASMLDGCDGEVARLKLQASAFGAWLETVCDYLYYLFVFVGMAVGLSRSAPSPFYLRCGAILLFGAVGTIFSASFGRNRLAGHRPEQYLAKWQKNAEKRMASNPLMYVGRNLEFLIRRCFLPYALFGFALLNLTSVAFVLCAFGANVALMVSLYSNLTFSPEALTTEQHTPSVPTAVVAEAR